MHIHRSEMISNSGNPYSAAADKAVFAQRAAAVRKRLMKSAGEIEGASTPEEAFMTGRWMDSRQNLVQDDVQYNPSVSGKNPDFG
jgi:hypothetical protein